MANSKKERVLEELSKVGITGVRAQRMEARSLYKMLHDDEHVEAAMRGRYKGDGAMFVATNKRMILLNYKPLFNSSDEIAYRVLSGVTFNPQGIFSGVVIHTRMGDFPFRYVNQKSAKQLVDYLERYHIEGGDFPAQPQAPRQTKKGSAVMSKEVHIFLASHNIGVLSTLNQDGGVNGAAVYYVVTPDSTLHIVTKRETTKARNIQDNSEVALTIYDEQMRATVQIRGEASVETDKQKTAEIMQTIIKPHIYNGELAWPPIAQIAAGPFQVIHILPTDIKFNNFNT